METDAAFIRADGIVELHAVSQVGLHLAAVVGPGHAECEYAVGFYHPFDDTGLLEFGMLVVDILHAHQHFLHCLKILFLSGMLHLERAHDFVYIHNGVF